MVELKAFRKANGLTQTDVAEYLGIGKSFISRIESGSVALPRQKLIKLIENSNGWDTSALTSADSQSVGDNNSGVVIKSGGNHGSIDNRHYYSDSPDVLRAQVELLEERIQEKEERLKEKDAQIKEKDAQIKEKDAQIKQLLDIIQGMKK